jgi:HPt (histidine-containing phosphotransfer) domain-containing protein
MVRTPPRPEKADFKFPQENSTVAQRPNSNPAGADDAANEMTAQLRRLAKAAAATLGADDPVESAEAALAELSSEFGAWMYEECERLEAARQDVVRLGLTQKTHGPLFRAAHDIKGEAATFGYPALAGAADSLCRLLEHTPQLTRIPMGLVNQHVSAVRAIFREYGRPDLAEMAGSLTARLRDVTDEFLEHENSFRPEYLDSILAPPLVPAVRRR